MSLIETCTGIMIKKENDYLKTPTYSGASVIVRVEVSLNASAPHRCKLKHSSESRLFSMMTSYLL